MDMEDWQYTCSKLYFEYPVYQPIYVFKERNVCLGCLLVCCGLSRETALPLISDDSGNDLDDICIACDCSAIGLGHCQFSLRKHDHDCSDKMLQDIQNSMASELSNLCPLSSMPLTSLTISSIITQTPQEKSIADRLVNQYTIASMYEQPDLQEAARSVIPLEEFTRQCRKAYDDQTDQTPGVSYEEFFVIDLTRQLLYWFKNHFFQWTNQSPCHACTSIETRHLKDDVPTQQEKQYLASRVELYQCELCQSITRFPRYNHPGMLLKTRHGRCGEWANAFTLCCRAVGLEARLVLDWTDHIWTEIYVPSRKEWIHCDACENAWNTPRVYENGWGKKLVLCVAVGIQGVVDVTSRYAKWTDSLCQRRTDTLKVSEDRLAAVIEHVNQHVLTKSVSFLSSIATSQANKPADLGLWSAIKVPHILFRLVWNRRRRHEMRLLMEARDADALDNSQQERVKETEMLGRQSGSLGWRAARGELGDSLRLQQNKAIEQMNAFVDRTKHCKTVLFHMNREGNGYPAQPASLQLNGDAQWIQTTAVSHPSLSPLAPAMILRLTPALLHTAGSAFLLNPLSLRDFIQTSPTDLQKEVREIHYVLQCKFTFRMSSRGADWLAWVLQSEGPTALGKGGFGIGYEGIHKAMAIEFDTFRNGEETHDGDHHHIAVQVNCRGAVTADHDKHCIAYASVREMNDDHTYRVRCRFQMGSDQCRGSLSMKKIGDGAKEKYDRVLFFETDQVASFVNDDIFVGFTASTGGVAQAHDILDWKMEIYHDKSL